MRCAISSSAMFLFTQAMRPFSRPFQTHKGGLGEAPAFFPGETKERRACRRCRNAFDTARASSRIYRPRERGDRWPSDRSAFQARDFSVRRPAHGRSRRESGGIRGGPAGPRSAALDLGINVIDAAPAYGFGRAEEIVGGALAGGRRVNTIIATKVGLEWRDGQVFRPQNARRTMAGSRFPSPITGQWL
jgi:hypothetical protein